MPMISFAQNAEDVLLNRLFPPDHVGFYIDVGANHPTLHSVTRHFYDRGWSGVNIEPVEYVHAMLVQERSRDVNLNIGVSRQSGTMTLHVPQASLGMSTLSAPFAAGLRAHGYDYVDHEVEVQTLSEVCQRHAANRVIDFLKIDVEGHELEVIAGGDWSLWRPRVVVVEATVTPESWEWMLLRADYLLAAFDGLNRYYIRHEDQDLAQLLQAPANVLDDFLPFEHWSRIHSLEVELKNLRGQIEQFEHMMSLRSRSLDLARSIHGVSRRFPRAARLARHFWPTAG
jgi:FkbM family methyltransferase